MSSGLEPIMLLGRAKAEDNAPKPRQLPAQQTPMSISSTVSPQLGERLSFDTRCPCPSL